MNKREKMYARIRKHGENLIIMYPNTQIKDPIALCKRLRILEGKAHKITEDYCNGILENHDEIDEKLDKILMKARDLLGTQNPSIFINRDPRGYALKIEEPHGLKSRDWGGYGILAPDLSED